MRGDSIEAVRDRRAVRAPGLEIGPEHEVIDKELAAAFEKVGQRDVSFVGFESVLLVDPDPRQFLTLPRHLVAAPRQFLFCLEQLDPGGEPLVARDDRMRYCLWRGCFNFAHGCFPLDGRFTNLTKRAPSRSCQY
jgi:hypothetical protein